MEILRFLLRCLVWAVLGLAVPLALLAAVWLPFNLRQTDAAPRPPQLESPAAKRTVPDERNAAFLFAGLAAQADRDPVAVGRAWWSAQTERARLPAPQRLAGEGAFDARRDELFGKRIEAPSGPPMMCGKGSGACLNAWWADLDGLARQRQAFGVLGERCDRALGPDFAFEELLIPEPAPDQPLMHWALVVQCSRWFRSGAVLAQARGQRERAIEHLRQAERLHRGLLDGSHSLIGQVLATRMAHWTYDTMAALAMRDARLADAFAPWLAEPLDTRIAARRWMRYEAAGHRGTIDFIARDGMVLPSIPGLDASAGNPWGAGLWADIAVRLARRGIGMQPERTRQQSDAWWQRAIGRMDVPWPVILAGVAVEGEASARRSTLGTLRWQNTFGAAFVELGMDRTYVPYFARQADQELHRDATALVLALVRQKVPPAQRAAAAARLAANPPFTDLKDRMVWSADGRTLDVRTWQSETRGANFQAERDAIAVSWP